MFANALKTFAKPYVGVVYRAYCLVIDTQRTKLTKIRTDLLLQLTARAHTVFRQEVDGLSQEDGVQVHGVM